MVQARDESGASLPPPISETPLRPYQDDSDAVLLERIAFFMAGLKDVQRLLYETQKEAEQRMETRGATSIPSERFRCELVSDVSYDRTVPESWNTAKVKAMARKYGDAALAVVERARVEGRPRLKFEVR